ncbi:hypothetical protein M595_1338 [Lyngbya aestuarii BL J]|uniref:Uncharacterized protein n=2 Tax=Lyngbya aestuarii BL J TaxID=1348334 RepID=U7QQB3_9CYAN|nr:hypothetical protein [Lyngbya aestuarii]ERT08606.1 hypothetical protein M595_1338 [Lyngbya aestuarii BL J]
MNLEELDIWFSGDQRRTLTSLLRKRVGLTRIRAEYFVRLWVYLLVKQKQEHQPHLKPPLAELEFPQEAIACTQREAAKLFYCDSERGSDRAAGMMLDKLERLGLIKKFFDGTTTCIEIQPMLDVMSLSNPRQQQPQQPVQVQPDAFDPRCDTIPIANQLAPYYNWMYGTTDAVPHRLAQHLRHFAQQYSTGMRVLRRSDNLHPVGFYLLFPTAKKSENLFFTPPSRSISLAFSDVDAFEMAKPGDENCLSIFIRSWMIDRVYQQDYQVIFLQDVQQVLVKMQQDFPNICDLYALLIHPSFEGLIQALGFQKLGGDSQSSISWIYLPVDRFLALDIQQTLKS